MVVAAAVQSLAFFKRKNKMEVYIVWFHTGEYGDSINEIYKIFLLKDDALKCWAQKNAELREAGLYVEVSPNNSDSRNLSNFNLRHSEETIQKFGFSIDYTGASYSYNGPCNVE